MKDRERAEDKVVALLAAARARDRAPAALRTRIERDGAQATVRRSPAALPAWLGRRAFAGGLAAAVAAAVLAIALAVPSGSSVLPSISEAAALALRGPAAPAPPASGSRLRENVGEVAFPNWISAFGYRAFGERRTRVGGHLAVTVYYRRGNETVAYLIIGAPARWASVSAHRVGRLQLRALKVSGYSVVTWLRGKDTCMLVSPRVTTAELVSLAGWADDGGLGADRDSSSTA